MNRTCSSAQVDFAFEGKFLLVADVHGRGGCSLGRYSDLEYA